MTTEIRDAVTRAGEHLAKLADLQAQLLADPSPGEAMRLLDAAGEVVCHHYLPALKEAYAVAVGANLNLRQAAEARRLAERAEQARQAQERAAAVEERMEADRIRGLLAAHPA